MSDRPTGFATFHTRAESWECDIHRHWSTRFFCRTFERAAEAAFLLTNCPVPANGVEQSLIRFHHEVLESDAITVESFGSRKADPESIVHCMFKGDRLVASARDEVATVPETLAELPDELEKLANARGLKGMVSAPWDREAESDTLTVLGAIQAQELGGNSAGRLPMDELFRRSTYASLHHIADIGFSADFTREHHIGRMVAEMRYQAFAEVEVGKLILGASRLVRVDDKSFITSHMLTNQDGNTIGIFDLCSLAVDLNSRKVCPVPDFLRERVSAK